MEDEARARKGVVADREKERGSHLKPWECENGERLKLKLAVTHRRKRKRPKFENLASNLLKSNLKASIYCNEPLNR